MYKSRNIIVLILICCMIALPGCSRSSAEKKPSTSGDQKAKAPAQLKTISSDLDTLISELDKKYKVKNMAPMQQNVQLIPQTQTAQSQVGQSQGSQAQSGQSQTVQSQTSQSNQSQVSPSQGQGTDWQKEFSTLKNLHTSWNTLMPEAVSAGMSVSSRDLFDKALEQLTQNISKQKLEESLSAALVLYKNYADLTSLFTTQVPAEFYQVKYEVMAAIFESSLKNWPTAADHVPKMKEHWVYFSAQATQADAKLLNQTSFAISDLEKAIQSKQMELVIIKGEIAMTNLKNLEEKLSAQQSDQG